MASFLSRAVRLSSSVSSHSILHASRSGIVLPRFVIQRAAVRWSSTATALKVEEVRIDDALPTKSSSSSTLASEPVSDEHSAIEEDQAQFSTLAGRVSPATLKAVTVTPMQLTNMSPVQAAVLPMLPELIRPYKADDPIESTRDLLVKARTGTGKTIAFLIPAIEARLAELARFEKVAKQQADGDKRLQSNLMKQYALNHAGPLILSPTRELATQIAMEASKLLKHHPNLQVHLFVGGESKRMQMKHWQSTSRDIIVATPGRLRDLLENEGIVAPALAKSKMLVLDEADTLLDMGFREEIEAIAKRMAPSPERQTFLFSATVAPAIRQIAKSILAKDHAFIDCVPVDSSPVHAHVPQYHTILPSAEEQFSHVLRLIAHDQLANPEHSKVLLFLPTTKMTQLFGTLMTEMQNALPKRTRVYEIHSKRTQMYRTRMSDYFRKDMKGASVLVSSDVSARGVDYPGVTRVIQVGVPASTEQYVHRVGRTGRGKEKHGRADLVLLPWEHGFVSWQLNSIPMKPLTVTELETQVKNLAHSNDAVGRNAPFLPKLSNLSNEIQKLRENMDPDAIKETMASLLGYYISRSGDLRCQKSVIVTGLKNWTVEACGLPEAPYVSEKFLARMGAFDPRSAGPKRGMQSYRRDGQRTPRQWQIRDGPSDRSEESGFGLGSQGRARRSFGVRDGEDAVFHSTYGSEDRGSRSSRSGFGGGGSRGGDHRRSRSGEDRGFMGRDRQSGKSDAWFVRGRERAR